MAGGGGSVVTQSEAVPFRDLFFLAKG